MSWTATYQEEGSNAHCSWVVYKVDPPINLKSTVYERVSKKDGTVTIHPATQNLVGFTRQPEILTMQSLEELGFTKVK